MSSAPPLSYDDIRERIRNGGALPADDELLAGESPDGSQPSDPFAAVAAAAAAGGILAEPLTRRVSGFGALAGAVLLGWQLPGLVDASGSIVWIAAGVIAGLMLGSLAAIAGLFCIASSVRSIGAPWTILFAAFVMLAIASLMVGGNPLAGLETFP